MFLNDIKIIAILLCTLHKTKYTIIGRNLLSARLCFDMNNGTIYYVERT